MRKTMKTYVITDRAGPYVAGRRVSGMAADPDGKRRISLAPDVAEFDLGTGALAEDSPEKIAPTPGRLPRAARTED